MYDRSYRDHIAVLKKREARPSFENMAALIAEHDRQTAWLFLGTTSGVSLLSLVALIVLSGIGYLALRVGPSAKSLASSAVAPPNLRAVAPPKFSTTAEATDAHSNALASARTDALTHSVDRKFLRVSQIAGQKQLAPQALNAPEASPRMLPDAIDKQVSLVLCTSHAEAPLEASAHSSRMPVPIGMSRAFSSSRFYLGIGGSLAQEMNSQADYRMFSVRNVFLSGGYVLTPRVSLGMVASQERFIVSRMSNITVFHTQTTVQSGVTYSNLIGEVVPSHSPITTSVLSLAGSVRYTIGDDLTSPFVEVLGGGSSEGALAETSAGMSLFQLGALSLDGKVFFRALIPQNSATLTKLGVSAAARFEW